MSLEIVLLEIFFGRDEDGEYFIDILTDEIIYLKNLLFGLRRKC